MWFRRPRVRAPSSTRRGLLKARRPLFFASVRACRLGSLNARCARHLPHPTPGLCTARRSKRLPTATQPGLRPSTTESPDPRRNRFKGRTPFQPPPPRQTSLRPPTNEPSAPPPQRGFKGRTPRPAALPASPQPAHLPQPALPAQAPQPPQPAPAPPKRLEAAQKKQPSPRWGRLSSLCSNRLRGRSHGAEARS